MPPLRAAMPHQIDALRWVKRRRAGAVFMQMRLGKCLVALRWSKTRPLPDTARRLILAPLSTFAGWRKEIAAENLAPAIEITGTRQQRERAILANDFGPGRYLLNPEALAERGFDMAVASTFARLDWDEVIVDESTRIRSPKAKTTKVALSHLSRAPFKLCLSGLPNPESPRDFVCQMLFLYGEFMGHKSYWTWRQEHEYPAPWGGWEIQPKSLGLIVKAVREQAFFLSRKEAGLGGQKLFTTRTVKLPKIAADLYREALADWELGDKSTANALVVQTWLSRLSGGCDIEEAYQHNAKLDELVALLRGEFAKGKIVVWGRFTAELLRISATLEKNKISHRLVYGGMGVEQREKSVLAWKLKAGPRVLVAQPLCLQMGVDLSEADTAVFLSTDWKHETRSQAEERTEHPKKERPTLIVDIVAEATLDEDIAEAVAEKHTDSRLFSRNLLTALNRRSKESR